jgi:uncharacterized protein with LGFP repeats
MLAWMAEAYREQIATLTEKDMEEGEEEEEDNNDDDDDEEEDEDGTIADGTAQQQAWIERLLCSDSFVDESPSDSMMSSSAGTSVATAYTSASSGSAISPPASPPGTPHGAHTHHVHTNAFHDDQPAPTTDQSLLKPAAHVTYAEQLEDARVGHLADSTARDIARRNSGPGARARQAIARRYQELMGSLSFGRRGSTLQEDSDDFDESMFEQAFIPSDDAATMPAPTRHR